MSPSQFVIALYDYVARDKSEISFKKDDTLIVYDYSDAQWWTARTEQSFELGFIPANYVSGITSPEESLSGQPWYRPNINYHDATKLCQGEPSGNYFVRDSQTHEGRYVLVVKTDAKLLQYAIYYSGGRYSINRRSKFGSVAQLIDFYKANAGLVVAKGFRLKMPVALKSAVSSASPTASAPKESPMQCGICFDNTKDAVFNCGHLACFGCAEKLNTCHICRQPITTRIKMYLTA